MTEHTCDAEYEELCIACVREQGMKLFQFGVFALSGGLRVTAPLSQLDDTEAPMPLTDLEESAANDARRNRLTKLRQTNMTRHNDWNFGK